MHKLEKLSIDTFDFDLPEELIAQYPLSDRGKARLMCINGNQIEDAKIEDLPNVLSEGDLVIFNNTKVIPARLIGKIGDRMVNLTLHYSLSEEIWLAFAKKTRKLKVGDIIVFSETLRCSVLEKLESGEIKIEFDKQGYINISIFEMLERYGYLPLPPYIKRENINTADDRMNYQSVFAKINGAVAAPTASLHFTDTLVERIKEKGAQIATVTLHVGAGTFLPVKVDNVFEHKMHKEYGEIGIGTIDLINKTKLSGGKIVAVGTTSLRVLEYVAKEFGELRPFKGEIDLFILPNFEFRVVDRLITNFHLPKSTLFMLVSAFCGIETMRKAYKHAIDSRYRFFSYGDCCFLNKREHV